VLPPEIAVPPIVIEVVYVPNTYKFWPSTDVNVPMSAPVAPILTVHTASPFESNREKKASEEPTGVTVVPPIVIAASVVPDTYISPLPSISSPLKYWVDAAETITILSVVLFHASVVLGQVKTIANKKTADKSVLLRTKLIMVRHYSPHSRILASLCSVCVEVDYDALRGKQSNKWTLFNQ
jgi:hypothetical protein